MKTKLTTIFKKSANTPPMWVCLLFALVISTNCWGDVTVTWGSYSGDNSLPSTPNVSAVNGLTLSSNMSVGDLVGHPTYRFTADNTQYVDISVGSDFFISNVETSVLYDGGGAGRLYIQFCTSETYFDGNKKGDPIELLDLVSWGEWNTANPPLRSVSSVEENVKSARIYRVGANTYGTNLYRIRVSAVADLTSKSDAELALEVTEKSIPVGGTFNLGVSIADGYDGEISYSISPAGVVSLNEGTGVVTGTAMGEATISVTASTTENYIGSTETCTVHVVKNFAGTLTASENNGTISLNWFYNLPISLATKGGDITHNGSFTTTYADGIRYFTYTLSNNAENKYFGACDFKTPNVPNCKSFSFEYRGENNGTNPRVVPYAWLDGGAPNSGNIVANPVEIRSTWDEVTVIPSCNYYAGAANINNGAIDGLNFASYPVGCVAFFPMADGDVSEGTLQLRNAYFQIINSNSLTSSVALVRKDGSAPADASDGVVRYTGAPTTFADNSGLLAGHTYYYRVFATYNGYTYASAPVSVTMPGTAKKDPELSLPASSAVLKEGDTYTLEPTVAVGYDGTLAYEITAGSDKISLSGSTITAEAAGTATVRVTASETTEYNQVTANFTVTVLAVPETNLAIKNVDGDNVTLTWDVPGKIDLSTAKTTPSSSFAAAFPSFTYATKCEMNNNEELTVTYSADGNGSITGILIDVNLTSVESLTFDYKSDYSEEAWNGIFPGIYNSSNSTMYWEADSYSLNESTWQHLSVIPSKVFWGDGTVYPSGNISELGFFANKLGGELSNSHMYIRNVFYHCTGMTDIDHIVIMRTTGAAATDTVSGTKIYSGKMSHFVDTDSKAAGLYYYTLFAVYANGCIPVEHVSAAYENPYKTHTRTGLTAGDYGTICLPYAVAAEDIAGAYIYEFNGWQTGSNVVELDLVDAMEAGHPYIYQATASEATWRYLEQNYTAAGSHKGLIGSYTKEEITPNDGNYIIYANQLYLVDCTQIYVGVNKAYIKRPDAENAYEATSLAPGKKRVYMGVYGEQVITDIDQITNDQSPLNNKIIKDNQLFILRDGKIYNAQGQLVK